MPPLKNGDHFWAKKETYSTYSTKTANREFTYALKTTSMLTFQNLKSNSYQTLTFRQFLPPPKLVERCEI